MISANNLIFVCHKVCMEIMVCCLSSWSYKKVSWKYSETRLPFMIAQKLRIIGGRQFMHKYWAGVPHFWTEVNCTSKFFSKLNQFLFSLIRDRLIPLISKKCKFSYLSNVDGLWEIAKRKWTHSCHFANSQTSPKLKL